MKKQILILALLISLIFSGTSMAAVSGETLINSQDSTQTGTTVKGIRVKDAGTVGAIGITSGAIASGSMMYDTINTNYTGIRGDTTNGLWVNIKNPTTFTFAGNHTPSDAYTNPTDAINSYSLFGGWNGGSWERIFTSNNNTDGTPTRSLGILETDTDLRVFNGTGWDRSRSGVNMGQALVDNSSNASVNVTTNTTTVVKATAGVLNAVFVNAIGTTSTAKFYNIASAGCTGTPGSGFVFTMSTVTLGQLVTINHTFSLGICVVSAGAAAADFSALYR